MHMKPAAVMLFLSLFTVNLLPAFGESTTRNMTLPDASSNSTLSHNALGGFLVVWSVAHLATAASQFYDLHKYRMANRLQALEMPDIEMVAVGNAVDPVLPLNRLSPAQTKMTFLVGRRILTSGFLLGDAFGAAIASAFLGGSASLLPEGSGQNALNAISYVGAGLTVCLLVLATSGAFTPVAPKKRVDIAINYIITPSMLTLFGLTSVFAAISLFDAGKYTQKPQEVES